MAYRSDKDVLADWVSRGYTPEQAGRALRLSPQRAAAIWQRIVDDLGWQARA